MSFRDKVNSVKDRAKQGASNLGHRAATTIKANTTDLVKEQFDNDVQSSRAYQTYQKNKAKAKAMAATHMSFQNRLQAAKRTKNPKERRRQIMSAYAHGAAEQFGNTDIGKKTKEIFDKIKRTVAFIADNIKVILICSAIVVLGSFITIFSISMIQTFGKSPHYYCEVVPDEFIKDTEFYKQYCERNPNSFELETLNGHYIVQDGSDVELQKACALNNMLLRFWCMNEVNWYDCLWDETGKYPNEPLIDIKYQSGARDLRHYVNGNNTTDNTSSTCFTGNAYGATAFAKENDISNWKTATWGYLRDNTMTYANQTTAGDSVTKDHYQNENWVWDLTSTNVWDVPADNETGDLNLFALSNWTFRGGDVDIYHLKPGEKIKTGDGQEISAPIDDLDLLNMILGQHVYKGHPEGIVVYTDSAAILITGWDSVTKSFICIDSSLGLVGGFEGPITKSSYCKNNNNEWNDWLKDPENSPIKGYYIINASFDNEGRVTMGVTDSRALDNAYAYPANPDPIKDVVFGAPPSSYAHDAIIYASTAATLIDPGTGQGIPYSQAYGHETYRAAAWTPDYLGSESAERSKYNTAYDCIGLCRMAYIASSRGKIKAGDFASGCTSFYKSLPSHDEYVLVPLEEIKAGDIILMQTDDDDYIDHAVMWLGKENLIAEAGGTESGLKVHEMWGKDKIWAVVRIYPKGEGPV